MMFSSSLHVLDREGYIDRFEFRGRVRGTRLLKPEVRGPQLKLDADKLREKERRDRAKLKMMIDFAYARTCRQQAILRYFGEAGSGALWQLRYLPGDRRTIRARRTRTKRSLFERR